MLTRLEVDGFKNLLDVTVDFGPFTCIAGPNGVGKSNHFDAIEFLSHLATDLLADAARRVRRTSMTTALERTNDVRDIFWDGHAGEARRMRLAAEMLVPARVRDDLGIAAPVSSARLRYEVELAYEPPSGPGGEGRLSLVSERLSDAGQEHRPRFPHSESLLTNLPVDEGREYLFTLPAENAIVLLSEDRQQRRASPLGQASRTLLSSATTSEHATALAAQQEMRTWRRMALEPSALRSPSAFRDPRRLVSRGAFLAGAMYRIAHDAHPDAQPDDVFARIAGRLAELGDQGIDSLTVDVDEGRELFTIMLTQRNGLRLPARALSDGTLRFLALCAVLEDPDFVGLLCLEQPEDGVHPASLPAVVRLLHDIAVDPAFPPGIDNPMRQVMINTHSPAVVVLCDPEDLLLAKVRPRPRADGTTAQSLSLLPYRDTWRAGSGATTFTDADVVPYLTGPPHAHLRLPQGFAE